MHVYVARTNVQTALVSQLPHRFADAWNRHDMDAAFADFHDDADFIGITGERWNGWEEIVNGYAALHATAFANSELSVGDVRVRLVSVDTAYVVAEWTMHGSDKACGGTLTFVVARQGSSWRVFCAQVTGRTDAARP